MMMSKVRRRISVEMLGKSTLLTLRMFVRFSHAAVNQKRTYHEMMFCARQPMRQGCRLGPGRLRRRCRASQSKERGEHWGLQHIRKSSERRAGRALRVCFFARAGTTMSLKIEKPRAAADNSTFIFLLSACLFRLKLFFLILPNCIHRKSCFCVFGPPPALFPPCPLCSVAVFWPSSSLLRVAKDPNVIVLNEVFKRRILLF